MNHMSPCEQRHLLLYTYRFASAPASLLLYFSTKPIAVFFVPGCGNVKACKAFNPLRRRAKTAQAEWILSQLAVGAFAPATLRQSFSPRCTHGRQWLVVSYCSNRGEPGVTSLWRYQVRNTKVDALVCSFRSMPGYWAEQSAFQTFAPIV